MWAPTLKLSEIVDAAIRAYNSEASPNKKHYAGVLKISQYCDPSTRRHENALTQFNDYTDRLEGWK